MVARMDFNPTNFSSFDFSDMERMIEKITNIWWEQALHIKRTKWQKIGICRSMKHLVFANLHWYYIKTFQNVSYENSNLIALLVILTLNLLSRGKLWVELKLPRLSVQVWWQKNTWFRVFFLPIFFFSQEETSKRFEEWMAFLASCQLARWGYNPHMMKRDFESSSQ